MVVAGFVQLLGLLAEAETPLPFTVGVALQPAATALFAHLLLSFPTGRLRSRTDRVLVTLGYVDAVAVQLVMLLVMDEEGAGICPCPENLLYVWDAHTFHEILMATQRLGGVLLTMAIVAVVAARWYEASPPLRRSLTPVLSTGAVTAILGGLWYGTWQFTDGPVTDVLALAATASLALLPLGFLVGLLRARLARAAVGDLVIELGRAMRPGEVRDALARALGDPSLQLAYFRDAGDDAVDLAGAPVALPAPAPGQVRRVVTRDGRRIAAVVHDASLADDPDLVDAALAAATLALENERLQAELRARLEDLRGLARPYRRRRGHRAAAAGAQPARRRAAAAGVGVDGPDAGAVHAGDAAAGGGGHRDDGTAGPHRRDRRAARAGARHPPVDPHEPRHRSRARGARRPGAAAGGAGRRPRPAARRRRGGAVLRGRRGGRRTRSGTRRPGGSGSA